MRILIIVHKLTGGGAERVASLWARGFVENGHHVNVVMACKPNTPITYTVPSSVGVYNIWNFFSAFFFRLCGFSFIYVYKLRRLIRSNRPDVIIGVMQPWSEISRKAVKKLNIPIIHTEHNSFERPNDYPMSDIDKKEKFVYNKLYNHITVLTEADKELINDINKNISVLPNPLAFTPISFLSNKENVILAVGRLDAWYMKGFDLLIKAWGRIAHQYPDWKLKIAGTGSYKSKIYLNKLKEEQCLEGQLDFLGYVDILSYYQKSAVFVLSSRFEGFGMALIEAMSQGCACIACDYKGRQREIITSEEGVLIAPESVECLTDAISRLIENGSLRNEIARKGIERSMSYELPVIMKKWEKILNGIKEEQGYE